MNNKKCILLVSLIIVVIAIIVFAIVDTTNPGKNIKKELIVEVGGESITITEENFGQYLGKIVTNYEAGGSRVGDIEVSTTYRLYWIDFDNEFGDGVGTIYLKADTGSNGKAITLADSVDADLVHKFNPSIPKETITEKSGNNNMKAITYMLTASNWDGLKTTNTGGKNIKLSDVNYVIGGVPLEMMVKSYNKYYNGAESWDSVNGYPKGYSDSERDVVATDRLKLYCKYQAGEDGYRIGPGSSDDWQTYTADATVQGVQTGEENIGSMYYPGNDKYYWLASPSASNNGAERVMRVSSNYGGHVSRSDYTEDAAFSPLVSLKSDVQLVLADS